MNKAKIESTMRQRLQGAISFEQFVEQAIAAGVEYLSHVHQAHACTFYDSGTYFSFELPYTSTAAISPSFDVPALNRAIKAIDEGQISPEQFYIQKALAGVSVTHLFLRKNRIIYIGLNGELHLEEW